MHEFSSSSEVNVGNCNCNANSVAYGPAGDVSLVDVLLSDMQCH